MTRKHAQDSQGGSDGAILPRYEKNPVECRALDRARPDPFTFVIFGASGDLASRKLVPALYALYRTGVLPDEFEIVGHARTPMTDEQFRAKMRDATVHRCEEKAGTEGQGVQLEGGTSGKVPKATSGKGWCSKTWEKFAHHIHYVTAHSYEDPSAYEPLHLILDSPEKSGRNRIFYLAVQPALFLPIVQCLGGRGFLGDKTGRPPRCRLVVEKPFGTDLLSARLLDEKLKNFFSEEQIFRIDHYLGKETVQNILVLRFANTIFEPVWNNKYVDHVQITIAETVGIEGRGKYYDQAGVLRDMIQNHAMQLLTLEAMEAPASLAPDAIRNEKVEVLQALRPIPSDCIARDVVRGQYAAGTVSGTRVPAYREELGVAPDSQTETYVALKLQLDNWRWAGTPFYVRTGKRLASRVTEISLHFKPVPDILFNLPPVGPMAPNILAMRIQPDEGVFLQFQVKVPGPVMCIRPFEMDFGYKETFGGETPEAYERLLFDVLVGDQTLFARSDEVEAAWRFVAPVIEGCAEEKSGAHLAVYPAGSWGPHEADRLLEVDGRRWWLGRARL
ncbi:MAG: glucose-6-phosphate dehydrogenase [Kiritimatiellae bacterium]|nr:glucose-6-phosphate dehydrogenase [Kiritimatiellia bacterium]